MDTDLRLMWSKYRKARVIHRYNISQVRCAVSRYGFELKRRHIYVWQKTSKDAERDLLAPVSFDEFEKPTYEQWQAEVEKALKGGDFHKKMFTKTYEGITLQPIYTPALHAEAIPKGVYPGAGEFLRGTKASGYIKESWGVSPVRRRFLA